MIVETQEKKRSTKFQGENLDNFFKMKMITHLCYNCLSTLKQTNSYSLEVFAKIKITLLSKQIETNGIEIHVSYKSTLGGKNLNLKAKITEFDQNLMLFLSIPYWSLTEATSMTLICLILTPDICNISRRQFSFQDSVFFIFYFLKYTDILIAFYCFRLPL